MRSLSHRQESLRFAFYGRYSTDFLAQHSWLIDISHVCNECGSSPVRDLTPLASHHIHAVPGSPHQTKFHHHTTCLHQSSPPPSMILESSRTPMQVTPYEVGDDCHGNGRDDGGRISRVNQCLYMTIPASLAHTEEPRTNNNYFSSKREDLLGRLGLGKYGGSCKYS